MPFECVFAGKVEDESKIEKAFHLAFGPYRLNAKREFFQIEPEQAIALLELMVVEEVTPELQEAADQVDEDASESSRKLRSARPVQNFIEMGMSVGDALQFTKGDHTCKVLSERRVEFEGEDCSLTALTQKLLDIDRPLRPAPYWTFNGKKLSAIYEDTYEVD